MITNRMTRRTFAGTIPGAVIFGLFGLSTAQGQEAITIELSVKNHQFQPAEIHAPANKRIVLRIKNLDTTPMEFESVSLRVEKVVAPSAEGIINLRPLQAGRYKFFDDFNRQTSGTLIVQ